MKRLIGRFLEIVLILFCVNCVSIVTGIPVGVTERIFLAVVALLGLGVLFFLPYYKKQVPMRLVIMMGGYELLVGTVCAALIEVIVYIILWYVYKPFWGILFYIANVLVSVCLLFLLIMNGTLRIIFTSKQGKIVHKVLLLFCWWMPGINIYCMVSLARSVRREYYMETSKLELNAVRAESQICHTRYPIVMVHGVFFRDWQLFNYWGRVPGKQQSAATIAESAQELKEQIIKIVEENHCEKVNIIAHSKGGLDSRYAISCLGLEPYVASLTTINTPHDGCVWAENILGKVSDSLLHFVAARYEKIFTVLGDKKPDFISAVQDLTASRCKILNEEAPDKDSVYYQSVMSKMRTHGSDGFPLNISHRIVQYMEGDNDGLVCADAAKRGHFLGILQASGKRGISHGDMIDLRRENIPGFDVREYYVNLVKDLKDKGY